MGLLEKAYYQTWNIGFIESSSREIVASNDSLLRVHWLKHNYKDRFFADPFVLSVDENVINVLVEIFALLEAAF